MFWIMTHTNINDTLINRYKYKKMFSSFWKWERNSQESYQNGLQVDNDPVKYCRTSYFSPIYQIGINAPR